jgi:hypothetical protein
MSEDQNDNREFEEEDDEGQPAPTPFDNPFFLPVLLGAFALWCAWDIITDAPAYQDHPWFNIGGLVGGGVAALYFTWSAIKEKRAERENSPD